jgi:hypothetical protein
MAHVTVCAAEEVDDLEALNGLLQFDAVRTLANEAFVAKAFVLTIPTLLQLHRLATQDIYSDAGQLRDGPVWIGGTAHEPPPASEVSAEWFVVDLFENAERAATSPEELAGRLPGALSAHRFEPDRLVAMAQRYGSRRTQALVRAAVETAVPAV